MSFERVPESQGLDLNEDVPENGQAKFCSLNVIQDFSKNKIGETEKIKFLINAVRVQPCKKMR